MGLEYDLMNLKMVMFGGKGGVGKTSCATSAAIWAAEHGRNTLIISTDPAHSLGDSLDLELPPGEPTPVPGLELLTALEINPQAKMSEFQEILGMDQGLSMGMEGPMGEMMDGVLQGMLGDEGDSPSLNPPGIDEALAFGKVLEFIETNHDYDLIVFDTAPTGHTLRLLGLPETMSGWIGRIIKLKSRVGRIFGSIKRMFDGSEDSEEDDSMEVLERLNYSILNAREDITNPLVNTFIIVMIPEEMAIAETNRLLTELLKYGIPNTTIVVNQLYQDPDELCDFCKARRSMQEKNLKKITSVYEESLGKSIIEIPLFREEVKGYSKLKEMGQFLIQ